MTRPNECSECPYFCGECHEQDDQVSTVHTSTRWTSHLDVGDSEGGCGRHSGVRERCKEGEGV